MTTITQKDFGCTQDGQPITEYILTNKNGMAIHLLNYGCIVKNIIFPAEDGPKDLILGFDTLREYEADDSCLGAITGRYAGRIRGAAFDLDGRRYDLLVNDGSNFIHGTLFKKVFDAEYDGNNMVFTYTSPDGEDGFPGNLKLTMTIGITDYNQLVLDYVAETDQTTHINLTTHLYLNLNGQDGSDISNHALRVDGFMINEPDKEKLPTDRFLAVSGSDMDFQEPRVLGKPSIYSFESDVVSPIYPSIGIDHNYVLRKKPPIHYAASAYSMDTGIGVSVSTTQPGLQVYTATHLTALPGKGGVSYPKFGGIVMEPQHFPNSPNMPQFPSTRLEPGKRFHHQSIFEFYQGKEIR